MIIYQWFLLFFIYFIIIIIIWYIMQIQIFILKFVWIIKKSYLNSYGSLKMEKDFLKYVM